MLKAIVSKLSQILLLISVLASASTIAQITTHDLELAFTSSPSEPHAADSMWIEPSSVFFSLDDASIGDRFNVTIWLNVTSDNVCAYQIALYYNCSHLKGVNADFTAEPTSEFMEGHDTATGGPLIDTFGNGSVFAGESCKPADYIPAPRAGSVIWIEFEIIAEPSEGETLVSLFDISSAYPDNTFVLDENLDDIPITTYDGTYTFGNTHDIAVIDITISETSILINSSMFINVTVKNEGTVSETFNVTVYVNTTVVDTFTDAILVPGNFTTLSFAWNTTGFALGNYTISAYAWPVLGETDTADNLYVDGTVKIVPKHDITIISIILSKRRPAPNEQVYINVTLKNNGYYKETFQLNVNYTFVDFDPMIGTQTVTLVPGEYVTLSFTWTPLGYGRYEIKAYTSIIPEDINPSDNTKTTYIYVGGSGYYLSFPRC